ncbi:MAG: hypothetical protein NT135_01635 [Candidatus Berkelbacteria bacterium]|nr:hypothetical protein [Candidatus Berkelbacteria bacterium]
MSLKNINDDLHKILDQATFNRRYNNHLTIDSKKYNDLTVKSFLSDKKFNLDNPSRNYKEIHLFDLGNLNLIITTEDKWLGDSNYTKGRVLSASCRMSTTLHQRLPTLLFELRGASRSGTAKLGFLNNF